MNNRRIERPLFIESNLDYLLRVNHMDIKELSIETGISVPTLFKMRRGGTNPTVSTLQPLLEFFRVTINDFLFEDMNSKEFQRKNKIGEFVHIPVYELKDVTCPLKPAKIIQFIGSAGAMSRSTFGVKANTDSLTPVFHKQSIVVVDPELTAKDNDYVICFLENDKQAVFRQLLMDGSQYFFKPINPGFGGMQAYTQFKILGVAIKSIDYYR